MLHGIHTDRGISHDLEEDLNFETTLIISCVLMNIEKRRDGLQLHILMESGIKRCISQLLGIGEGS